MRVFAVATNVIWQNPAAARRATDSQSERLQLNTTRKTDQLTPRRNWLRPVATRCCRKARERAPTMAPRPWAATMKPNPLGPTWRTWSAKSGTILKRFITKSDKTPAFRSGVPTTALSRAYANPSRVRPQGVGADREPSPARLGHVRSRTRATVGA